MRKLYYKIKRLFQRKELLDVTREGCSVPDKDEEKWIDRETKLQGERYIHMLDKFQRENPQGVNFRDEYE